MKDLPLRESLQFPFVLHHEKTDGFTLKENMKTMRENKRAKHGLTSKRKNADYDGLESLLTFRPLYSRKVLFFNHEPLMLSKDEKCKKSCSLRNETFNRRLKTCITWTIVIVSSKCIIQKTLKYSLSIF